MKTFIFISGLLIVCSCKKSADTAVTRLLRTESTDYNGHIFYSEYGYDNQDRISTITNHEDSGQTALAVTISYNGNEVTLLSHPEVDPLYNTTTEVHLTLDANGRTIQRIEYTRNDSKPVPVAGAVHFTKDTLLCEYDAGGLLSKTTESRYDTTSPGPGYYSATRLTATTTYTNDGGNLITADGYAVYPRNISQAGVVTVAGGTSQYHNEYKYTKSFANKTDFKNAAVLNEYALYYEPWLNRNYKNMSDQAIRSTVDKDISGAVIFTGTSTIDIERVYNSNGLLSTVNVTSHNTPYTTINYFYGR